jgi:hypothetical protein
MTHVHALIYCFSHISIRLGPSLQGVAHGVMVCGQRQTSFLHVPASICSPARRGPHSPDSLLAVQEGLAWMIQQLKEQR